MSMFWESLHFLRPQALWLVLLVPLAMVAGWRLQRRLNVWTGVVDAHLLVHLLSGTRRRPPWGLSALALGITLAALALAGPSWRQVQQPLLRSQAPLVVLLDLSSSITASDLQPSRLLQARAKLATLLRERDGGEIALVVYAGEAFTVAPLTDDVANVALFLDALAPEVMPVDGQRADKAIEWATTLLQQAGSRQGDILLMSGNSDDLSGKAAAQAAAQGHRVSVLGLGTPAGAAYRARDGRIEHTQLDEASLRALAAAGGGRYVRLTTDDADLQALGVLQPRTQAGGEAAEGTGRMWRDEGYWLLPPLMLLALLAFRRRSGVVAVLALACLLPVSLPARAEDRTLWQRADQLRHRQLSEGVDAYHRGDFSGAQQRFEGIDSDQGWYNLGNALARQGKYDEAIAAYDNALRQQPGMADAVANRAAVEAARKRQQQGSQDGGSGKPSEPEDAGQSSSSAPSQGAGGNQQPAEGKSPGTPAEPATSKPGQSSANPPDTPQAEDAQSQQQADQAQRERMQQAVQQQRQQAQEAGKPQPAQSTQERERRQAIEAWMQRVPDEPGSLLKAKFQLEYERRQREGR